jgi:hypothetical protein
MLAVGLGVCAIEMILWGYDLEKGAALGLGCNNCRAGHQDSSRVGSVLRLRVFARLISLAPTLLTRGLHLTCPRTFIRRQLESRRILRRQARVEQHAIGRAGRVPAEHFPPASARVSSNRELQMQRISIRCGEAG